MASLVSFMTQYGLQTPIHLPYLLRCQRERKSLQKGSAGHFFLACFPKRASEKQLPNRSVYPLRMTSRFSIG